MIKNMLTQAALCATLAVTATIATSASAEITVSDAYARAVPPGQMNSASFMTLNNSAAESVALISGKSSAAKVVELHTHTNMDGVMQMRQVDKIELPAAGSVVLQPGGYHVMLIGLNQDLAAGSEIDLELNFSDGSQQQLQVPVKNIMGHGHKHHGH